VHCGWGAPAEHCGEPPAQPVAGRGAAQPNLPPGSEVAGYDLTRPPGPTPRGIPAPKPKSRPHGGLIGPTVRSTLPLVYGLSVILSRLLSPAPAPGAILRASRPARSLARRSCLSRDWPHPP
jgi:hypothetical protein